MGLDAVELVLETERRFDIQIPDKEACRVRTVGEFYELVLRKLGVRDSNRCLTAGAFYRLRRALIEVAGIHRRQIHPQRPLEDVLPVEQRHQIWPILSQVSRLKMPELRRPLVLENTLVGIGLLFFFGGLGAGTIGEILLGTSWFINMAVVWGVGAVVIMLFKVLTRSQAVHPAGTCRTVGDLSRAVFDVNSGTFIRLSGEVNRKEVWQSLRRLIAEQLGMHIEDITPASRFVEDLNCG